MVTATRGTRRTNDRPTARKSMADLIEAAGYETHEREGRGAAGADVVDEQDFAEEPSPFDPQVVERDATPSETFDPEFSPFSGQQPEPWEPEHIRVAEAETAFPHYYHAWSPQLTVRRGRPEGFRFRGSRYQPRTAQQEANVRAYLKSVVPGGNPDRWMGDTPSFDRELRCPECGFFTSNLDVFDDHNSHTNHNVRIPNL